MTKKRKPLMDGTADHLPANGKWEMSGKGFIAESWIVIRKKKKARPKKKRSAKR